MNISGGWSKSKAQFWFAWKYYSLRAIIFGTCLRTWEEQPISICFTFFRRCSHQSEDNNCQLVKKLLENEAFFILGKSFLYFFAAQGREGGWWGGHLARHGQQVLRHHLHPGERSSHHHPHHNYLHPGERSINHNDIYNAQNPPYTMLVEQATKLSGNARCTIKSRIQF